MRLWDKVRAARLGRRDSISSIDSNDQSMRSSARLGGIYPQPPTYRRICCNDREANLMARFKVCFDFFLFSFLGAFGFGCWFLGAFGFGSI